MSPSRTYEELSSLNTISAELAEHIAARPVKLPSFEKGVQGLREARAAHLRALHHLLPIPGPIPDEVGEKDVLVDASDGSGYQIRVRVYSPTRLEGDARCPVIILFHEGGWMFGDLSDEEMNARLFARELGAVCLNVEYRLAPEYRFPTGIGDCWTVLKAASENPERFHARADPRRGLVVGGSSAGGNISAVLAQRASREGVRVTGQWLSCPYILPDMVVPEKYRDAFISMGANEDDPVIGPMGAAREAGMLKAVGIEGGDDPLFTPMSSELYPPRGNGDATLPVAKAYFSVAGMDPLRDHALVYEQVLGEEWSVETKVDLYPGYGHMFWTNWPEMVESKKFWGNTVEGISWLLQSESSSQPS